MSNPELEKILLSVLQLSEDSLKAIQGRKMSQYQAVALGTHIRAARAARAILVLCREGLTEEAMMLGRSILEGAVTLEYIKEADSEERAELFLDYAVMISHKYLDMAHKDSESGSDSSYARRFLADPKGAEMVNSLYQRISPKYAGHEQHWAGKGMTIKAMAERVELADTYKYVYRFLSERVHGSVSAIANQFSVQGDALSLSAPDFGEQALALAALYLLDIMAVFDEAWGCGLRQNIDAIYAELQKG